MDDITTAPTVEPVNGTNPDGTSVPQPAENISVFQPAGISVPTAEHAPYSAEPITAPAVTPQTGSNSAFSRVVLVDWLSYSGAGDNPKSEILEFAWAVYDVSSECVMEKVRHILRPTDNERTSIPTDVLQILKLSDARPLEHAKTFKQVLTEFDSACSMVAPPSVCVVISSMKLRDQLLSEIFRKGSTVPKCLKGVLDLATLVSHFYPQECPNAPVLNLLDARSVAGKLGAPLPDKAEEFSSMDGCVIMSQIVKKMHGDSIEFQPHHLSTVITAPVTTTPVTPVTITVPEGQIKHDVPTGATSSEYVIRMRGVPWDVADHDIIKFVEPICQVTSADIHIATNYEGRATGEVLVRLPTMAARDRALAELHGKHLGRRWVEVFKASEGELSTFASLKESQQLEKRGALRLRGLPYSTNEYEIVKFFTDSGFQMDINSVVLGQSRENRLSGDAWVLLESPQIAEDARRALHKKSIGRRYIELFQSSPREVEMARKGHIVIGEREHRGGGRGGYDMRHSPYGPPPMHGWGATAGPSGGMMGGRYGMVGPAVMPFHQPVPMGPGRGDRGGHGGSTGPSAVVRLRGLPYYANENHIVEFFHGFGMATILPATAPIDGRPSGEAYIEFVSPDEAWRALKQRQGGMMDRRYIELFPATKQEMELAAAGMDPRELRMEKAWE